MDKENKLSYDPPKMVVVAFRVENGLLTSFEAHTGGFFNPFGDGSWDAPSSLSRTNIFGVGDWTGGSSFSNNNSFGSGSWDEN